MPPHDSDRQVKELELACVRSGRTLDQVAFLARIPMSRLQAAELEALVSDRTGWNPQHAAGYAERVGQWCREMGSRAVVCDIYMHPLGGERCEVDCEMFDISEEMEAHELVRASEQLLRSLAGALPVGVVQFDLDRRIVYANERLYEIVGAHPDTDEDTLLTCVVDSNVVEDALARLYSGGDVDVELYMDRLDGSGRRLCTLAMRALINGDGAVIGGVACLADITDAARMRA